MQTPSSVHAFSFVMNFLKPLTVGLADYTDYCQENKKNAVSDLKDKIQTYKIYFYSTSVSIEWMNIFYHFSQHILLE